METSWMDRAIMRELPHLVHSEAYKMFVHLMTKFPQVSPSIMHAVITIFEYDYQKVETVLESIRNEAQRRHHARRAARQLAGRGRRRGQERGFRQRRRAPYAQMHETATTRNTEAAAGASTEGEAGASEVTGHKEQ